MIDIFEPTGWPKKYRRVFVLTLPVSAPLLFVAQTAVVLALVVVAMLIGPLYSIEKIWRGK